MSVFQLLGDPDLKGDEKDGLLERIWIITTLFPSAHTERRRGFLHSENRRCLTFPIGIPMTQEAGVDSAELTIRISENEPHSLSPSSSSQSLWVSNWSLDKL